MRTAGRIAFKAQHWLESVSGPPDQDHAGPAAAMHSSNQVKVKRQNGPAGPIPCLLCYGPAAGPALLAMLAIADCATGRMHRQQSAGPRAGPAGGPLLDQRARSEVAVAVQSKQAVLSQQAACAACAAGQPPCRHHIICAHEGRRTIHLSQSNDLN